MRRAAKRDANEPEIIEALEAVGCVVFPLNQEKLPDLLVVRKDGVIFLLEVKNGEFYGKLTPGQEESLLRGLPFEVVQDRWEALHAVGIRHS